MKRLKMKNCNTIFTERPEKYLPYLQVGFIYIYKYFKREKSIAFLSKTNDIGTFN